MADTQTDKKFAVIQAGGKQYVVHEGDEVDLEKLDFEAGEEVEFDAVLATGESDDVTAGASNVSGNVVGEVVEHGRGKKKKVMKFKRKKKYKRVYGHRQDYTTVKIVSIG